MSNTDYSTHSIVTTYFQNAAGEGWEFSCCHCGYQARYFIDACSNNAQLDVINLGDERARHISEHPSSDSLFGDLVSESSEEEVIVDESWLTPEIIQKLEGILSRLDD